ncbi:unnamed protein product [Clonostachys chloroleuca]|uniref:Pali-domain-containing protein n=1 Tax=Clonostachys chloroleuca TaxID=1926264 RepID=A0AA35QE38_9HYPO|nr:unnamed protein product [Clonostachys chloroleuca]
MSFGSAVHFIGSFILMAALILTIVINISAPVANQKSLSFTTLSLTTGNNAWFGVFGYCWEVDSVFQCTKAKIGYDAADIMKTIAQPTNSWSWETETGLKALSVALIMHPIGSGVTFIAFLLSLPEGTCVSIMATLVSLLAAGVNICALVIDAVMFKSLEKAIKDAEVGFSKYGVTYYLSLAVAIASAIAFILMLFTCCAGRRERRNAERKVGDNVSY